MIHRTEVHLITHQNTNTVTHQHELQAQMGIHTRLYGVHPSLLINLIYFCLFYIYT